jgi:hypothetical protein
LQRNPCCFWNIKESHEMTTQDQITQVIAKLKQIEAGFRLNARNEVLDGDPGWVGAESTFVHCADVIEQFCKDELEALLSLHAPGDQENEQKHCCSGCGHRWRGQLKGAELCGDCWRKGQAVILGHPHGHDDGSGTLTMQYDGDQCVICRSPSSPAPGDQEQETPQEKILVSGAEVNQSEASIDERPTTGNPAERER